MCEQILGFSNSTKITLFKHFQKSFIQTEHNKLIFGIVFFIARIRNRGAGGGDKMKEALRLHVIVIGRYVW